MKILIISQYYFPDITAAANRIGDTAALLSKAGNEVTVITATPHKSLSSVTDFQDFDLLQEENIIRVSLGAGKSPNSAQGLLKQYFSFSFMSLIKVFGNIKKISPDVVWISSPPLPITLVSIVIKYFFRVPVVLDIRDIWPESAVNIGKLKRGSFIEKLGLFLEKISYYHADEITCVSSNMKDYIETKTHKRISTIFNAVSLKELKEPNKKVPNKDIFCYAGNIGHAQDIELIIKSFAKAKENEIMGDAVLHLIGDGALLESIKILVSDLELEKSIKFFGAMAKDQATKEMLNAGCLLLPLKDAPAFRLTVPSKVFDYMALSRPIISNISGEGAKIIARSSANIVVKPSNLDDFSNAILNIRKNWPTYYKDSIKNHQIIVNEFTREKEVKELETILLRAAAINKK